MSIKVYQDIVKTSTLKSPNIALKLHFRSCMDLCLHVQIWLPTNQKRLYTFQQASKDSPSFTLQVSSGQDLFVRGLWLFSSELLQRCIQALTLQFFIDRVRGRQTKHLTPVEIHIPLKQSSFHKSGGGIEKQFSICIQP